MVASFRFKLLNLCLAATVGSLVGCGRGGAGAGASGSVTIDGKPLESGNIVFEPLGAGKMAVGVVSQGTYLIPAAQSPTAGEYRVRITAERATGQAAAVASRSLEDQAPVQQYEQYLPAKYNARSELTVEVLDGPQGPYDFSLTSK